MRMMHKIESVIKLVDETITQLSQLSKKEKIISSSLEDTKIRPSKTYRKASLVDNNQSEAEQIRSKNMTVCKQ